MDIVFYTNMEVSNLMVTHSSTLTIGILFFITSFSIQGACFPWCWRQHNKSPQLSHREHSREAQLQSCEVQRTPSSFTRAQSSRTVEQSETRENREELTDRIKTNLAVYNIFASQNYYPHEIAPFARLLYTDIFHLIKLMPAEENSDVLIQNIAAIEHAFPNLAPKKAPRKPRSFPAELSHSPKISPLLLPAPADSLSEQGLQSFCQGQYDV